MVRDRLFAAVAVIILLACGASAQLDDRAKLEKEIDSLRAQLKEKEQRLLEPSAEDRARFAEFLKQNNTGLIRLLPREKFEMKLTLRGGGAYYSFTEKSNEYISSSHIELERGNLRTGFAGANFGFITALGDVPIESVGLNHPAAEYLSEFVVPSVESEAREQYRQVYRGVQLGGFSFRSLAPVSVNTTYLLRSINYRDSDVLVALRIVRQDADESVTLLWKLLKKFPAPELAR